MPRVSIVLSPTVAHCCESTRGMRTTPTHVRVSCPNIFPSTRRFRLGKHVSVDEARSVVVDATTSFTARLAVRLLVPHLLRWDVDLLFENDGERMALQFRNGVLSEQRDDLTSCAASSSP